MNRNNRKISRLTATAMGSAVAGVALWIGLSRPVGAAAVPDPTTCLPTCAMDGRALVVAGDDDTTLNAVESIIGLNFTAGAGPTGGFELFDADRNPANWDTLFNCGAGCPGSGASAPELMIELFADPAGTGGSGPALATWTPGAVPSGTERGPFPAVNNAWSGVTFPNDASALNPLTNNYQYALHLQPVNAAVDRGWNAFKVRAAGTVILLGNQVVGFIGAMNVPGDLPTIYPSYPALTPTSYDGTWSFKTRLPSFLGDVTIYDGDMDFGAPDCSTNDTDDPDSSGIPSFGSGSAAVDEGIAVAHQNAPCASPGVGIRTSTPAEDNTGAAFRRVPSIVPSGIAYQLKAPASLDNPGGQIFLNQNPSGNREWEQFKIQLVDDASDIPNGACPADGYPADPAKGYPASDCRTTDLPGGVWEIQVDGMDLSNLNFWFFGFKVEPIVTEYSIGRLVWYDDNQNGAQDLCSGVPCAPELGIQGVAYTVYDGPLPGGSVVRTGVTDAKGEFAETALTGGNYTIVIDTANFAAAGPLEGLTSTTGGETQNGIEVGLPVCIDTHNPVGCGEPIYAEAIFGYVLHSEECVIIPIKGGAPFVGAVHTLIPNPPGAPAGAMTIRTTLNKERFVDNTYGANAIGWPGDNHSFSQLVGSDRLELTLYNSAGVKKLEFVMDYISASSGAPGGYKTLGVTGGDGSMILGGASNIWAVDTSLSVNFRDPVMVPKLTVNSPPTDANYTPPAAPYTNWIFDVYYDVTFLTDIFGPAGFGYPRMSFVHASPSKTGSNSEICVYANERPVAVADAYVTTKNHALVVPAPGILANDFGGNGGALTAVLFAGPTRGTLVGGLQPDGSFTYSPKKDFKGDDKFTYQASNGNGLSTVATVSIKVTK